MVKLVIDPGHGGTDSGATGFGVREKDVVLDVALRLRTYLNTYHIVDIAMTRESDTFPTLTDRSNFQKRVGGTYFISLHSNGGGGTGFETFIFDKCADDSASAVKRKIIHDEIKDHVLPKYALKDRGPKKANYAVLRETSCEASLIELAFTDTVFDTDLLKRNDFKQDMAEAIGRGLAKALALPNKNGGTPSKPTPVQPPIDNGNGGGIGILSVQGKGVNVRSGAGTNFSVKKQINGGDYVVFEKRDGWFMCGSNEWIYGDPSYTSYKPYQSSEIGKLAVVKNNSDGFLWVYDRPDWDAKYQKVKTGDAFTIADVINVDGYKMFKLKSGLYITANSNLVDVR